MTCARRPRPRSESLGGDLHRADVGRPGERRGRVRPGADRGGAPGAAGRADRAHRQARRGDHHRAGAGPAAAAAGHRRRAQGDDGGLGHRRHGRQRARRQRRRIAARRDGGHRERRDDHRRREPAVDDADRGLGACTRGTSARCSCTWSRTALLAIDPTDDLQAGVVITHDGQVVHPAVAGRSPAEPGGSRRCRRRFSLT